MLAAEIAEQPEDEREDNRDYYAACKRDIDAPVLRAEFEVTRQFKETKTAEEHYKGAEHRNNDTGGNQPLADLLRSRLHRIKCRELSGIYRLG